MLDRESKKILLALARRTIREYFLNKAVVKFETENEELKQKCGAFVTLHNNGKLRGCIGVIESDRPLYITVEEMAVQAARNDPRFEPLSEEELKDIDIEISVLYPKKKVESAENVDLEKHGVIVKKGFAQGVFLPQVAKETNWSKTEFMEHLCSDKAGLKKDAYLDPETEIYVFEADVFSEKEILLK
ncbi:MAG: AmmeMemoRadiSam system protein A [Candidatus Goldiibacteriota bacterium]